jgi:hypothetical protein
MRTFWAEFENIHVGIEEAIPAGSHVVLAVRFSGRGKRNGVEIDMLAWPGLDFERIPVGFSFLLWP